MKSMLLIAAAPIAAFAFASAPAQADHPSAFSVEPGQFDQFAALPTVHRGVGSPGTFDRFDKGHLGLGVATHTGAIGGFDSGHRGDRHDRRRGHHGRSDGDVFVSSYYDSDGWAYYNNRSWAPDSFNDWWHDRPDRAYPRWVQEQRGGMCDPQRMWSSGAGWRC